MSDPKTVPVLVPFWDVPFDGRIRYNIYLLPIEKFMELSKHKSYIHGATLHTAESFIAGYVEGTKEVAPDETN